MFAVGVNQKIHRSVRMVLSFTGLYEPRLIRLCLNIKRQGCAEANTLASTRGGYCVGHRRVMSFEVGGRKQNRFYKVLLAKFVFRIPT